MTDLADHPRIDDDADRRRRSLTRWDRILVSRVALTFGLVICLAVPEGEIRAKLFKANVIVKNIKRLRF